jgi:hypothetical protein
MGEVGAPQTAVEKPPKDLCVNSYVHIQKYLYIYKYIYIYTYVQNNLGHVCLYV